MGSMDATGNKAVGRRVTADPPVAPGRACYKPRRVRAGSSPLVIAHMAVESARLVAGNEVTATMPAAGFRERAGYHRTRTTRCPSMGAVRVPGSTRHQDARMSLVFVSGSDWPPAPARFNAPRGGLRAAGICNQFVAAQVEETEPRSAAGLRPGRRDSVDTWGGSRAAETRAAGEKPAPTSPGALRPLTTHVTPPRPRQAAESSFSARGTR